MMGPMSTPKWYSVRASARPRAAELFIFGDIGESWWGESVTAAEFVRELAAIDADEITVRINSYGGSVTDGLAIYNALRRHPANVIVSIDGVAASIASLIAMAGDEVEMAENALMMVHAPWGGVLGNAVDMREFADVLDRYAQAMSTSYAAKTGRPVEEMLALLTDGEDHWFTAAEAQDAQFVDSVTAAVPIAASLDLSRFKSLPAAAAAFSMEQPKMTEATKPTAAAKPEPAVNEADIVARALSDDRKRRADIAASFQSFAKREGVAELMAACQEDNQCDLVEAKSRLLAHLAKGAEPLAGGYVATVEDEQDKFRSAATAAIMARAAARDADGRPIRVDASNPLRGYRLIDLAKASLERAGRRTEGMTASDIAAAALTQTTSDFPILLETAMHKTLQQAYAAQPDTWSRFCKTGSVSDFREHKRYRAGSLSNLSTVGEGSEYKNKAVPDGEKSPITAVTKGDIIAVTRQMLVNDDLSAFMDLSGMLGRAAKRTIEADVYALLNLNSGMGPTMTDTNPFFHSSRLNIAADGDLSVTVVDSMRSKLASQKDPSGNEYLDLRLAVLVVPTTALGTALVINEAQYDPDTANKLQKPNIVRGLFRDVVASPRLTTRVYAFADPNEAPAIEVAFLDGIQEPYLQMEEGFRTDGVQWKVRLEYGVAVMDHRAAVTAKGAA